MPIRDPFILSAYHYDLYPAANGHMGLDQNLLKGKNIGNDFDPQAKWRMYHGETIPGFPYHPHRGFEIVTIAEEGYADHFDSQGSKGRYGNGDVQLMSAGAGILHGEMFPLLHDDKENPLRLFQIWLNLPGKDKLTPPQYKMLWSEKIPIATVNNNNGGTVKIKIILGNYYGVNAISPLPHSWAKNPKNHIGIALVNMDANTTFELPAINSKMKRFVFFYDGKDTISVADKKMQERFIADLNGGENITITNGAAPAKLLILEGMPIEEPIAAYGPFVMNTEQELQDAFNEFRSTQFGGWPWGENEISSVNPKDAGRFASYDFGKKSDQP